MPSRILHTTLFCFCFGFLFGYSDLIGGDSIERSPNSIITVSMNVWNKLVETKGNSYKYVDRFKSWTGYGTYTTTTVRDGKVVRRDYWAHDDKGRTVNTWSEIGKNLGKHAGEALTVDEIYQKCEKEILAEKNPDYEVTFKKHKNGLISACYKRHKKCEDDCNQGFFVTTIEWLKD